MSGISFQDIPGQSALFKAYLSDPLSLRRFYPNAFDSPAESGKFADTVLKNYETERQTLCDSLAARNVLFGAGAATLDNIERLREKDTVAVVTGQQAGLFSGPLYTIYKALSAIRLADELTANGVKAVPVFWMATEDHDFDEVSAATMISRTGGLFRAKYRPANYVQDSPVGEVMIDSGIKETLDDIFSAIPETEFSDDVRDTIESSWYTNSHFGDAFAKTLISLLGKFGLIIFDPLDPALKRLAAPIYSRAVSRADEIVAAITARNLELEQSGFHSQVKIDDAYFPLFWHDDAGRRIAIRKTGPDLYRAKGQKREFSREALASLASEDPWQFSPGVMLRGVVQDFLLPTVAYFGGGAEISYFAQNSVVYEILERPVTPVFHRQSFTILESKHRRSIEKLNLTFSDLFMDRERVVMDWATANIDPETATVFASAEDAVNTEMGRIDRHVAAIDTTLLDTLAKRRRKMLYHIGAIRKKALLALTRKNGDAERRIGNLYSAVMPNGQLQERTINIFSFVNRYGPNFIDLVHDAVDLNDKRHRIIEL